MNSVNKLRDNLSIVWGELVAGTITPQKAAEFANIAGKMINSAKVQIEYYALCKEKPEITFLKDDSKTGKK